MHQDISKILIGKEAIDNRVKELGAALTKDYEGKELIAVCILKGAVVFYADLLREIQSPLQMDFMSISSYGNSRKSSGIVQIRKDLDIDITDRHVLIIEDIMDSGQTLSYLLEMLATREPASLRVCCLLDKPDRRVANIQPDYCGFVIPDEFVVGYGLDYAEKYRNLDFVGVLKPSVYKGE